jgi:hypothetical protein
VPTIQVIVAATSPDLGGEGIAARVTEHADMALVDGRVMSVAEIAPRVAAVAAPSALLLIGPKAQTEAHAGHWLSFRSDLVVVRVDVIDHAVDIALRDAKLELDSLLDSLRSLVTRAGRAAPERLAHFQLHALPGGEDAHEGPREEPQRPLLLAGMQWIHAALRAALTPPAHAEDLPGFTLTASTLAAVMDERAAQAKPSVSSEVASADATLARALVAADTETEPLAAAFRAFRLTPLEFRILLLALAPELDVRYQRCMGVLLDDLGRRVATLGLCASLIGEPSEVRRQLARSGNLARWRVFEGRGGVLPSMDEPLRVDAPIAGWLLGERFALDHDVRVRRMMRVVAWPGASLVANQRERAASFVTTLQSRGDVHWLLFAGDDVSGWRALLELGAELRHTIPVRVDAARLAGLDVTEIEESGVRLGRLVRLTARPLVIDAWASDASAQDDDALRLLLAALAATGTRAGIVSTDPARIVRLLGSSACAVYDRALPPESIRADAVRVAAKSLDVELDEPSAAALAGHYPLPVEALEQATHLARARRLSTDDDLRRRERLRTACQDVASEGVSHLADRIEPAFSLADIVLPPDRARQLDEIVDSVRFASTVLDAWRFRDQLPYGRGVTALLHGASGTGKTMAAHGIASALGIQILRVDLSRVVSKYIGDTEKNIDRVFVDAQRSGAAILIDEADALLGKRSEVKDAHDRYANIEVAYLLQRMEAFDGLAILTTNMRQSLDAAFLRRLRFIVDFPRPDAEAREKIWRRCLPAEAHVIDDAAFHQLARRIELTGGHIRQITVRAAFLAAADSARIGLHHIAYASRAEFAKLGLPAVELELPQKRAA